MSWANGAVFVALYATVPIVIAAALRDTRTKRSLLRATVAGVVAVAGAAWLLR
jgi:hypothetical protein